ncbi:MAG: hypothetical protein DMG08_19665 [Acidobacteria bacterium]|nr:MAG: hypothetical protein DMG08_19665 [Acidobacteriota bacterium]
MRVRSLAPEFPRAGRPCHEPIHALCHPVAINPNGIQIAVIVFVKFVEFVASKTARINTN